ncbi:hypothetical protein KDX30_26140 [Pseudomonas sp. CDFA 553]|uniref:hypothetical protein n=1 Tax=Pseudomonas quasicaspiana TaxID=2829821 RepID=UPI001E44ED58|nr:hypothetical protein [Pseudomonas quasicaspiana]MCD5991366.1 hypothetical protein [Pseudomonas quasicaspiana]
MSQLAFPFLVLSDEAVDFDGWKIGQPNEPLFDAEDVLDGWDYEQDVHISANFTIDFIVVANQLRANAKEVKLRISLLIGTGSGNMPRRLDRIKEVVVDWSSPQVKFDVVILGKNLSSYLNLNLQVSLDTIGGTCSLLSPTQRGSRLWSNNKRVLIEDGGDARFPIELASFSEVYKGRSVESAPWLAEWNPENLHADFSGNVRFYVNSDIEILVARFVSGDPLTLQAMLGDIMTQMIEGLLDSEEHTDSSEYEVGSVGHQAKVWVENCFQGQSVENIRQLRFYSPGKFKAAIHALADFGGNE